MKLKLFVLLALLQTTVCAQAAIKIIYQTEPDNVNQDYKLSVDGTIKTLNHIGDMPEELPGIYSIGIDKALYTVFDELIPLDWKVYVNHELDDGMPITWDSQGENWLATLYRIGMEYELSFDINWNHRWVLVNKSAVRYRINPKPDTEIVIDDKNVPKGKAGFFVIDGKSIKIRRKERAE